MPMRESAISLNVKIANLTQQCFRRIHNTCENTSFERKVEIMNEFMYELCISGYNEKERLVILKGALQTHNKIVTKVNKNVRPYFRPNSFRKSDRAKAKSSQRTNWFKNSNIQYSAVMFVDATPGDKLLKIFKHIENIHRISDQDRIKFVSKSGIRLSNIVQKRDPFLSNCKDKNCRPSSTAIATGKVLNCKKTNICYMVECLTCKHSGRRRVYFGETSRNIHVRSAEHYRDCDNKDKNNWMRKHIQTDHTNENCEFAWSVMSTFQKPMLRQLTEAVHINNTEAAELLNMKTEYFHNDIKGVRLNNNDHTCRQCSRTFSVKSEFIEHFEAVHRRMKCKQCNYVSFGNRDLKLHTENRHSKEDIDTNVVT